MHEDRRIQMLAASLLDWLRENADGPVDAIDVLVVAICVLLRAEPQIELGINDVKKILGDAFGEANSKLDA